MISVTSPGSFSKTMALLEIMRNNKMFSILDRYGPIGVNYLSNATPRETGETANSWDYKVTHDAGRHGIYWYNTHVENGVNIAVILQYGHGTGTGGYVEGIDYINPALQPLFDDILDNIWRQVRDA